MYFNACNKTRSEYNFLKLFVNNFLFIIINKHYNTKQYNDLIKQIKYNDELAQFIESLIVYKLKTRSEYNNELAQFSEIYICL